MPSAIFNARLQVFSSTAGGTSDYVIVGQFNDETSNFFPAEVTDGYQFWDFLSNRYTVRVNNSGVATIMNLDVEDTDSTGLAPSTSAGCLYLPTTNYELVVTTREAAGITENVQQRMRNFEMQQLDLLIGGGAAGHIVEQFTLTATNITNGYVDVAGTLDTITDTVLLISGAPNQYYGDDFIASSSPARVSWVGLALDGVLAENDKITVLYK